MKILSTMIACTILLSSQAFSEPKSRTMWLEDDERARIQDSAPLSLFEDSAIPRNVISPAEFAKSEGVIVQPGKGPFEYYRSMIKNIIAAKAIPFIIVKDSSEERKVKDKVLAGMDMRKVQFIHMDYDTYWSRDYSPWFIYENGVRAIVDHNYKKPNARPKDDNIPQAFAKHWNENVYKTGFYTEGGNFMTDGLGNCWQSTKIFGDWSRYDGGGAKNPGMSEGDVDQIFLDYLGCENNFYSTPFPKENTGHIDLYMKVLNQDTMLVSYTNRSLGANRDQEKVLNDILKHFQETPRADGLAWNIVKVPMKFENPFFGGASKYYSHINSLIVNDYVLVPTYGKGTDDEALEVYKKAMPQHKVIGINSSDVVKYGGAIHCTTMQVPVKKYSRCGDGVVSHSEECEFNYYKGKTCESFGYSGGRLSCSQCRFEFDGCF